MDTPDMFLENEVKVFKDIADTVIKLKKINSMKNQGNLKSLADLASMRGLINHDAVPRNRAIANSTITNDNQILIPPPPENPNELVLDQLARIADQQPDNTPKHDNKTDNKADNKADTDDSASWTVFIDYDESGKDDNGNENTDDESSFQEFCKNSDCQDDFKRLFMGMILQLRQKTECKTCSTCGQICTIIEEFISQYKTIPKLANSIAGLFMIFITGGTRSYNDKQRELLDFAFLIIFKLSDFQDINYVYDRLQDNINLVKYADIYMAIALHKFAVLGFMRFISWFPDKTIFKNDCIIIALLSRKFTCTRVLYIVLKYCSYRQYIRKLGNRDLENQIIYKAELAINKPKFKPVLDNLTKLLPNTDIIIPYFKDAADKHKTRIAKEKKVIMLIEVFWKIYIWKDEDDDIGKKKYRSDGSGNSNLDFMQAFNTYLDSYLTTEELEAGRACNFTNYDIALYEDNELQCKTIKAKPANIVITQKPLIISGYQYYHDGYHYGYHDGYHDGYQDGFDSSDIIKPANTKYIDTLIDFITDLTWND